MTNSMILIGPSDTTVNNPQEKTIIQRQIEFIDNQIDQLVYELYGLTEDEIEIVEGKNSGQKG